MNGSSIMTLINRLHSNDAGVRSSAAARIYETFSVKLLRFARSQLSARIRRREDENDIVQEVLTDFVVQFQQGEVKVHSREHVWNLLAVITRRKIQNLIKRQSRQCRDYRRDQLSLETDDATERTNLVRMIESSPDRIVEAREAIERSIGKLPESLRCIVYWKLAGLTNEQIASPQLLNCSTRTVERKLERIRQYWSKFRPHGL